MTARVRAIEHGIVLQDFSNFADAETALGAFAEARAFVQLQPRGSILMLTDVTGSNFTQPVIEGIRDLAVHNKPWVRASALFGLTPIMRVICRALLALTGREIKVFETRTQAMAYLMGFSVPASAAAASPQTPSSPPSGPR
ncbi:MAG TPA: hypothetical protein VH083_19925 [Myxococcales bacterium]|jgi:hypothetical protein|nr:hypothetical protein [Myxococcales bacterium]